MLHICLQCLKFIFLLSKNFKYRHDSYFANLCIKWNSSPPQAQRARLVNVNKSEVVLSFSAQKMSKVKFGHSCRVILLRMEFLG